MSDSVVPLARRSVPEWLSPAVFGMVHLVALPGAPEYAGDRDLPLRRAREDVGNLVAAGYRGIMIENYGDRPFFASRLPSITVAAMTRVVSALRAEHAQSS